MAARMDLVLMWHMHQPDYRDYATREFRRPWVYLHALKDYTDMVGHLERHPAMRAVVNLSPVLLEQIEDYVDQFATGTLRDPLLRVLVRDDSTPLTPEERAFILARCFDANHAQMVQPFPAYKPLHEAFHRLRERGDDSGVYLWDVYFPDLVTW